MNNEFEEDVQFDLDLIEQGVPIDLIGQCGFDVVYYNGDNRIISTAIYDADGNEVFRTGDG